MKKFFKITGVDLSQPMLALARRLNPEIDYQAGDIRRVRLGKTFDSVIIHDAINYMLNEQELRAAFETAFLHLAPGGVFWTYAEVTVESFRQNRTFCTSHKKEDVEITFIENAYDPDPADTSYEESLVYLIRRKGSLEIETDRHLAGIFTLETWINLLNDVGFRVRQTEFGPESCPAFVCTSQ